MVDVFLSYSSKDRDRAAVVRDALAGQGFEVFWDQNVPVGVNWDNWIRQNLTQSKCAVVLWSKSSVLSENVQHEASIAKQQSKFLSALIDPLDVGEFPLGLYSTQAAVLAQWSGSTNHPEWDKLQRSIQEKVMPIWAQRAIHQLEAELEAERARRLAEESRNQVQRVQIAREAEAHKRVSWELESLRVEYGALQAKLSVVEQAKAELEGRAALASENVQLAQKNFESYAVRAKAMEVEAQILSNIAAALGECAAFESHKFRVVTMLGGVGSRTQAESRGA